MCRHPFCQIHEAAILSIEEYLAELLQVLPEVDEGRNGPTREARIGSPTAPVQFTHRTHVVWM